MIRKRLRRLLTALANASRRLWEIAVGLWETHLDAMASHAAYRAVWTSGVPGLLAAVPVGPVVQALGSFAARVHVAAFTPDSPPIAEASDWTLGRARPRFDDDDRPWSPREADDRPW